MILLIYFLKHITMMCCLTYKEESIDKEESITTGR